MNSKKWTLPKCPYCGKKLGFWEAWLLRTKGEYTCSGCGQPSNVKFDRITYSMAALASVLGLGILLVYSLLKPRESLWGILLVALPFVLFLFFSPWWMHLERFQPVARRSARETYQDLSGHTAAIPSLGKAGGSGRSAPIGGDTVVMPPVRAKAPNQAGTPVYRDSTGRPVGRGPAQQMRPTPPAPNTRKNGAFVPPPRRSAPPRQGGTRPNPPKQ